MKTQTIRDRLEKGMRVNVLVRPTPSTVKKKPAVVIETMRSAARVRCDDETAPRTIRFSDLEIPTREAARARATAEPKSVPSNVLTIPMPTAPAEPSPAATPRSSFEAWIEMGAELEADMAAELELVRAEKAALEAERAEIDLALEGATNRYAELHKTLEAIRAVRRTRS